MHYILEYYLNRLNTEFNLKRTVNPRKMSKFEIYRMLSKGKQPFIQYFEDYTSPQEYRSLYIPKFDIESFLSEENVISKQDAYSTYILKHVDGNIYRTLDIYGDENNMEDRVDGEIEVTPLCIMYEEDSQVFIELIDVCFNMDTKLCFAKNNVKALVPKSLLHEIAYQHLGVGKRAYHYKKGVGFDLRTDFVSDVIEGTGWTFNEETGRVLIQESL